MQRISYKFPNKNLLLRNNEVNKINYNKEKEKIENFFRNYKIDIDCKDIYSKANTVTYVIDLKCKTRVSTIKSYKEELMLSFNAVDVEFQVAVNETPYLGIHIIKQKNEVLMLGDLIQSKEFIESKYKIPMIIGQDFNGNAIIEDLTQLPHLLIAGTTGTGKSNLLNTFVVDILYKLTPIEVKLVLIDTRKINFKKFNMLPHLLLPVITDSKKVLGILAYLIQEMNNRYKLFEDKKVNNIDEYNESFIEKLPRIVVIIEDLYDIVLDTENEVSMYIQKLIQMSRASGIHIIISTQRPSTNVINGVIKAAIPCRITFKLPSQVDSKTIIDIAGAEKLCIYGDILFSKIGKKRPKRIQTPYISDKEIEDIVNEIEIDNELYCRQEISNIKNKYNKTNINFNNECEEEVDPLLLKAIELVIKAGQASTSYIQRELKIGYARSSRIIDQMEERGVISKYLGSEPRKILMTLDEWNKINK